MAPEALAMSPLIYRNENQPRPRVDLETKQLMHIHYSLEVPLLHSLWTGRGTSGPEVVYWGGGIRGYTAYSNLRVF